MTSTGDWTTSPPGSWLERSPIPSERSQGERTTDSIRAFLLALMQRKDMPLQYVLLAGDATYNRTDLLEIDTIPTMMSRTMYNGATSSDALYIVPPVGGTVAPPAIGRLSFREAAPMKAYAFEWRWVARSL